MKRFIGQPPYVLSALSGQPMGDSKKESLSSDKDKSGVLQGLKELACCQERANTPDKVLIGRGITRQPGTEARNVTWSNDLIEKAIEPPSRLKELEDDQQPTRLKHPSDFLEGCGQVR
jgi:hypothetical protein